MPEPREPPHSSLPGAGPGDAGEEQAGGGGGAARFPGTGGRGAGRTLQPACP